VIPGGGVAPQLQSPASPTSSLPQDLQSYQTGHAPGYPITGTGTYSGGQLGSPSYPSNIPTYTGAETGYQQMPVSKIYAYQQYSSGKISSVPLEKSPYGSGTYGIVTRQQGTGQIIGFTSINDIGKTSSTQGMFLSFGQPARISTSGTTESITTFSVKGEKPTALATNTQYTQALQSFESQHPELAGKLSREPTALSMSLLNMYGQSVVRTEYTREVGLFEAINPKMSGVLSKEPNTTDISFLNEYFQKQPYQITSGTLGSSAFNFLTPSEQGIAVMSWQLGQMNMARVAPYEAQVKEGTMTRSVDASTGVITYTTVTAGGTSGTRPGYSGFFSVFDGTWLGNIDRQLAQSNTAKIVAWNLVGVMPMLALTRTGQQAMYEGGSVVYEVGASIARGEAKMSLIDINFIQQMPKMYESLVATTAVAINPYNAQVRQNAMRFTPEQFAPTTSVKGFTIPASLRLTTPVYLDPDIQAATFFNVTLAAGALGFFSTPVGQIGTFLYSGYMMEKTGRAFIANPTVGGFVGFELAAAPMAFVMSEWASEGLSTTAILNPKGNVVGKVDVSYDYGRTGESSVGARLGEATPTGHYPGDWLTFHWEQKEFAWTFGRENPVAGVYLMVDKSGTLYKVVSESGEKGMFGILTQGVGEKYSEYSIFKGGTFVESGKMPPLAGAETITMLASFTSRQEIPISITHVGKIGDYLSFDEFVSQFESVGRSTIYEAKMPIGNEVIVGRFAIGQESNILHMPTASMRTGFDVVTQKEMIPVSGIIEEYGLGDKGSLFAGQNLGSPTQSWTLVGNQPVLLEVRGARVELVDVLPLAAHETLTSMQTLPFTSSVVLTDTGAASAWTLTSQVLLTQKPQPFQLFQQQDVVQWQQFPYKPQDFKMPSNVVATTEASQQFGAPSTILSGTAIAPYTAGQIQSIMSAGELDAWVFQNLMSGKTMTGETQLGQGIKTYQYGSDVVVAGQQAMTKSFGSLPVVQVQRTQPALPLQVRIPSEAFRIEPDVHVHADVLEAGLVGMGGALLQVPTSQNIIVSQVPTVLSSPQIIQMPVVIPIQTPIPTTTVVTTTTTVVTVIEVPVVPVPTVPIVPEVPIVPPPPPPPPIIPPPPVVFGLGADVTRPKKLKRKLKYQPSLYAMGEGIQATPKTRKKVERARLTGLEYRPATTPMPQPVMGGKVRAFGRAMGFAKGAQPVTPIVGLRNMLRVDTLMPTRKEKRQRARREARLF
jgi:hypothetical protein